MEQMVCIKCGKIKLNKRGWHKGPSCPNCYKKEWQKQSGTPLKYNPDWDKYVEPIKTATQQSLNISAIEKQLGLRHDQITTIAKHHGIKLNKRISLKRLQNEKIFTERLKTGISVQTAAKDLFNPKIAQEVAAMYGYKQSSLTRSSVQVLSRLKSNFEYIGYNFKKNKHEIKCKNCQSVFLRDVYYLDCECVRCISGHNISKAELEVFNFIQSLGAKANKAKIPNTNFEIDIYIPELKLGIEYCSLTWHSVNYGGKLPNYHYNKMALAEKANIRLVTVFEDEWLSRQEQVKGFLASIVAPASVKIFARKCTIRQITKHEADIFMDLYHIQGANKKSKVSFGLYHNDDLVGVITGAPHHRNIQDVFVLDRLCFKAGISVVGGASKLFSALVDYSKTNKYTKIISWSDNRWSQGNVYKQLNFALECNLPPDYSYCKGHKRFSKQSLKKNPKKDDMSKTERQLRTEQGYDRIYDCGKKRWVYSLDVT